MREINYPVSTNKNVYTYCIKNNFRIPKYNLRSLFRFDSDAPENAYNPVTTFQLGIYLLESVPDSVGWIEEIIQWLESNKVLDELGCNWPYNYAYFSYGVEPGFKSAMTQGLALSFYAMLISRGMHLELAISRMEAVFASLMIAENDFITPEGLLPFQEFPSQPDSNILNGFVFVLIGLEDYIKVGRKNDKGLELFEHCIGRLRRGLDKYSLLGYSVYDSFKTKIDRAYLDIHIEQITYLYYVTGHKEFHDYLMMIRWSVMPSWLDRLLIHRKVIKAIKLKQWRHFR